MTEADWATDAAAQLWCLPEHSDKEMDVAFGQSIAAALRKARADGPGWQTIDSAPRDGTRVLVFNGSCLIASWSDNPQVWGEHEGPCWTVYEVEDWFYSYHLVEPYNVPTHWQPLPPPPQA
jgi:hypothetical protein